MRRKGDSTAPSPTTTRRSGSIRNTPRLQQSRHAPTTTRASDDRAIADYNEAIRLDPKYRLAFHNRGVAWRDKDDFDRAIADYTEAIRLDPKESDNYNGRGLVWRDKGDFERAITDFTETVRLSPKWSWPHLHRGLSHLYSGALDKALADVSKASELNPRDVYMVLWIDIVGQRSGAPSRLAQAKIDTTKWPGPVVRLFLGMVTPAGVRADVGASKGRACEADFYIGMWELRQGAKDNAARLLRLAADNCPRTEFERFAANAELKQLGR